MKGSRPKSSFTTIADIKGSSIPSRPSTRPWSSPRYVTEGTDGTFFFSKQLYLYKNIRRMKTKY